MLVTREGAQVGSGGDGEVFQVARWFLLHRPDDALVAVDDHLEGLEKVLPEDCMGWVLEDVDAVLVGHRTMDDPGEEPAAVPLDGGSVVVLEVEARCLESGLREAPLEGRPGQDGR